MQATMTRGSSMAAATPEMNTVTATQRRDAKTAIALPAARPGSSKREMQLDSAEHIQWLVALAGESSERAVMTEDEVSPGPVGTMREHGPSREPATT